MALSRDQLKALAKKQLNQGSGFLGEVDCFAADHFPELRGQVNWRGTDDDLIEVLLYSVDPDRLAQALNKWHPIWVNVSGIPDLVDVFIDRLKHRFPGINLYNGCTRLPAVGEYNGSRRIPADCDIDISLECDGHRDTFRYSGNGVANVADSMPHADHARGLLDMATWNFPEVLKAAQRRWAE